MCQCIEKVNERLRPGGHELYTLRFLSPQGVSERLGAPLKRIDSGKFETRSRKLGSIAFRYCPFCGESQYEEAEG